MFAVADRIGSEQYWYQRIFDGLPDWVFPLTIGGIIAATLIELADRSSRLRRAIDRYVGAFVLEKVVVGRWGHPPDGIPESDRGVRADIRFTRRAKGRLVMHVLQDTGSKSPPIENVVHTFPIDHSKGEMLRVPIVDAGKPSPSWDPNRKRGWGPEKVGGLIRGASNIVSLRFEGRFFTQTSMIYVAWPFSGKGPCIFATSDGEEIFDAFAERVTSFYDA